MELPIIEHELDCLTKQVMLLEADARTKSTWMAKANAIIMELERATTTTHPMYIEENMFNLTNYFEALEKRMMELEQNAPSGSPQWTEERLRALEHEIAILRKDRVAVQVQETLREIKEGLGI